MSIRFAAPPSVLRNRIDGTRARRACGMPANDNGAKHTGEAMLNAALRHFAEHGLAAARHARSEAENALEAGDEQAYSYWLEVCRTLDRRMAQELDRKAIGNG